jgi:hypothetical protein
MDDESSPQQEVRQIQATAFGIHHLYRPLSGKTGRLEEGEPDLGYLVTGVGAGYLVISVVQFG